MRRREFMTIVGGAAIGWPRVAYTQQLASRIIGFLDPRTPEVVAARLRGFRQGLKDSGYVEGENVTIVYRWAEDQIDRLPALAVDLVRRRNHRRRPRNHHPYFARRAGLAARASCRSGSARPTARA